MQKHCHLLCVLGDLRCTQEMFFLKFYTFLEKGDATAILASFPQTTASATPTVLSFNKHSVMRDFESSAYLSDLQKRWVM